MTNEEMIAAAPDEYKAYLLATEDLSRAEIAMESAIDNHHKIEELCYKLYGEFIAAVEGSDSEKDKLFKRMITARNALHEIELEWTNFNRSKTSGE